MPETNDCVLIERKGSVLVITLNRPRVANAINPEVAQAVDSALNDAETNSEITAVIITGSGEKVFTAGQDLKALADGTSSGCAIPGHGWAGITERSFSKPLIAAVNGLAYGGGTEIALSCDMIIASENATFALPEVKRGIFAAGGGVVRLAKRLPKALALELLMTGDPITAQRAAEIGLVNRVVPGDKLMDCAIELANKVSANAPLALKYTKLLFNKAADCSLAEAFEINDLVKKVVFATEDSKEGPRAFLEKRAPDWKGR